MAGQISFGGKYIAPSYQVQYLLPKENCPVTLLYPWNFHVSSHVTGINLCCHFYCHRIRTLNWIFAENLQAYAKNTSLSFLFISFCHHGPPSLKKSLLQFLFLIAQGILQAYEIDDKMFEV